MRRMKKKTKLGIAVVAGALALIAVIVALGNVTKGFQNLNPKDWELREVNEANLYQSATFMDEDGVLLSGKDGVEVTLTDANVLKVSGEAEQDFDVLVCTVKLEAGKSYVFGSNLKDGTNKTIYLTLVDTATSEVVASYYDKAVVIPAEEIAEDMTF